MIMKVEGSKPTRSCSSSSGCNNDDKDLLEMHSHLPGWDITQTR